MENEYSYLIDQPQSKAEYLVFQDNHTHVTPMFGWNVLVGFLNQHGRQVGSDLSKRLSWCTDCVRRM